MHMVELCVYMYACMHVRADVNTLRVEQRGAHNAVGRVPHARGLGRGALMCCTQNGWNENKRSGHKLSG